jgi:hypothetical protein
MGIITYFNKFLDTNLDISVGLNEYLASVKSCGVTSGWIFVRFGLRVFTLPLKLQGLVIVLKSSYIGMRIVLYLRRTHTVQSVLVFSL